MRSLHLLFSEKKNSLGPRKQRHAWMKPSVAGLNVQICEFSHKVMLFFFFVFFNRMVHLLITGKRSTANNHFICKIPFIKKKN